MMTDENNINYNNTNPIIGTGGHDGPVTRRKSLQKMQRQQGHKMDNSQWSNSLRQGKGNNLRVGRKCTEEIKQKLLHQRKQIATDNNITTTSNHKSTSVTTTTTTTTASMLPRRQSLRPSTVRCSSVGASLTKRRMTTVVVKLTPAGKKKKKSVIHSPHAHATAMNNPEKDQTPRQFVVADHARVSSGTKDLSSLALLPLLQEQCHALQKDWNLSKKQVDRFVQEVQMEMDHLTSRYLARVMHGKQLEEQLDMSQSEVEAHRHRMLQQHAEIQDQSCHISALLNQLDSERKQHVNEKQEWEAMRRKMHNTLQELKGNIRVYCRVRPLLAHESGEPVLTRPLNDPESRSVVLQGLQQKSVDLCSVQSQEWAFSFDKVFSSSASQADVFDEISLLIQSVLDGYRVCIFAYGQTSAGKTFTMEGSSSSPELKGMTPRSVDFLFHELDNMKRLGWTFEMNGSFFEIYNEEIYDLLSQEESKEEEEKIAHRTTIPCNSQGSKDPLNKKKKTLVTAHQIRHVDGETFVTNLTSQPIHSKDQMDMLLAKGQANRTSASTLMNVRSSRSHCVFQLKVNLTNQVTHEKRRGHLNMIDLAGSERLSKSQASGDRLKETQAINKSLTCLGNVIFALAKKDKHIPYRDSKLTYFLQNSLGGDAKALMLVNVSPAAESVPETLCSLRFATKVNACDIGTATRKLHARDG